MMKQTIGMAILVVFVACLLSIRGNVYSTTVSEIPSSGDASNGGISSMKGETAAGKITSLDDRDLLIQMEHQWNIALKNHDVSWFEKNLADDFSDISSGKGALSTKAEDIENLKTDKTVYDSLDLSNLLARVEGNAGVVNGINHIKGHDEQGQSFEVRLSFTDTYIRRKGRWQAWASQHTRVKP
jgi:hypothetical protein